MTCPRSSSSYPEQMVRLALAAQHIAPTWRRTLQFPDRRAAQSWRTMFYGFRRACQRDNPELAQWLAPIVVSLRGNTLELSHRDGALHNPDLAAIIDELERQEE